MDLSVFLKEVVEATGGLTELEDGRLKLLADSATGLPELAEFPLEGPGQMHLGHPYLEQALTVATRSGQVGWRHYPETRRTRPGWEKAVQDSLAFRNCRLELGPAVRDCIPWAMFHFRATAVFDEKREVLSSVGVDILQGAQVEPTILNGVWLETGRGPEAVSLESSHLYRAYDRAKVILGQVLAPQDAAFRRDSARQLEVELTRMEAYFGDLAADLKKRLTCAGERGPALELKLQQLFRDRETRRQDLQDRLRVRWSCRLCCLELVAVPRLRIPARLLRKGGSCPVTLSYNFLTHSVDPLVCPSCASQGFTWYVCREGHLTCPDCKLACSDCGQLYCKQCRLAPCPDCNTPMCPCRKGACRCLTLPDIPVQSEPPVPRIVKPEPVPAPAPRQREGVLLRAFGGHLSIYPGLKSVLVEPDRQIARGQNRLAGETLELLLRDINPQCHQLRNDLKEVSRNLLRLPGQKALAHLEALAEQQIWTNQPKPGPAPQAIPTGRPPSQAEGCKLEAYFRRVIEGEEDEVYEHCVYWMRLADALRSSSQAVQGWLAASYYLASQVSSMGGVRQGEAAAVFGTSPGNVSQKSRELRRLAHSMMTGRP